VTVKIARALLFSAMAGVVPDLPLIEWEDGSKDLTDDLECDLKGDSSDGKSDSLMADISTLTLSTASDGPSEEGRTSSSRDDDWSLETTWLIEGSSSEGLLSLGEVVESLLKALGGLRRPRGR
jgi:hypothetical protein